MGKDKYDINREGLKGEYASAISSGPYRKYDPMRDRDVADAYKALQSVDGGADGSYANPPKFVGSRSFREGWGGQGNALESFGQSDYYAPHNGSEKDVPNAVRSLLSAKGKYPKEASEHGAKNFDRFYGAAISDAQKLWEDSQEDRRESGEIGLVKKMPVYPEFLSDLIAMHAADELNGKDIALSSLMGVKKPSSPIKYKKPYNPFFYGNTYGGDAWEYKDAAEASEQEGVDAYGSKEKAKEQKAKYEEEKEKNKDDDMLSMY